MSGRCQVIAVAAVFSFACAVAYGQETDTVKVAKVTFNELRPRKNYQFPMPIRVNADTTRGAGAVQVRLFPGRTLTTVRRSRIAETTTGCFILKSRVDSYAPTLLRPDVLITNIDSTDLWCGADGLYLPTPFVIVVESADVGDSSLFRIHPSQMKAYFANAGEFIVTPPPNSRCAPPVRTPPRGQPGQQTSATTKAAKAEERATVDLEVARQHCIEKVQ